MLELKTVIVMTLRELNVTACYDQSDRAERRTKPPTVSGERAYQVLNGTTRPADGFPCRVAHLSQ